MNDEFAIKVENVSKKYCKSLKRSMVYGVCDIGKNILGLSSCSERLRNDEFWAVNNVSFELKKGETLGIIGPNGSGKTSLLKMLNGIFWPDKGKITIKGRVGALIEVGAGFHPLLTGRENIYINAAILGMAKEEVDRKFDSIVEFAAIGDFLDAPVKHYSSGMFVRLGFAVAVHCDLDIFLIDEILAVGDVSFRAKCYNKIAEMMKNCAFVIVSHDTAAIARTSTQCMFLNKGKMIYLGHVEQAIQSYFSSIEQPKAVMNYSGVKLLNCIFKAASDKSDYMLNTGMPLEIILELNANHDFDQVTLVMGFLSSSGEFVAEWNSWFNKYPLHLIKGYQKILVLVNSIHLNPGIYNISIIITSRNRIEHLLWVHRGWTLKVIGDRLGNTSYQLSGSIKIINRT